MTYGGFGGALFLVAAGAILRYAVDWDPEGVEIRTVGLILMLTGAVLLVLTLVFAFAPPRGPQSRGPGPRP